MRGEFDDMLGAIRRQKMHRPLLLPRRLHDIGELAGRGDLLRTCLGRTCGHRRLRSGPHDVSDRDVVAEDGVGPSLDVDDGREARLVDCPEIQKRAVLPERVGVR